MTGFLTKYYLSCIIKTIKRTGMKETISFQREITYQHASTPTEAISLFENKVNYRTDKEQSVVGVTVRLVSENGQILMETHLDDDETYTSVPAKTTTLTDKSWGMYKYLTQESGGYAYAPTLRVEDHF